MEVALEDVVKENLSSSRSVEVAVEEDAEENVSSSRSVEVSVWTTLALGTGELKENIPSSWFVEVVTNFGGGHQGDRYRENEKL